MPIVNFVQAEKDALKGLPRIAKLHKGAPKQVKTRKDGTTYETVGRDLKHFRVEFETEYKHLEPVWRELYGDEPKRFENVLLNADRMDDALDFWKEEWTATTMLRRCDGEKQHIWYDQISGRYEQTKRACAVTCGCKTIARINLVLPEFIAATGVLGYVTLQTTSEEDLRTLIKRLSAIQVTYGTLRGVPFIFYREDRKTSAPDTDKDGKRTGKRRNVTRSLIDVQVNPDFTRQRILAALAGEHLELPAPRTEQRPTVAIPEISTADARQMLGSGGSQSRRIGGEEPQPSITTPPRWTQDAKRATGFLEWANNMLGLTEFEVLDAMRQTDQDIQVISDFTQDERFAMAALVAYKADYIKPEIARLTNDAKLFKEEVGIDVYHAACEIAESIEYEAELENA